MAQLAREDYQAIIALNQAELDVITKKLELYGKLQDKAHGMEKHRLSWAIEDLYIREKDFQDVNRLLGQVIKRLEDSPQYPHQIEGILEP